LVTKKRNKKGENQAIQAIKNQHSNYKWIKYMFCYLDEIDARLDKIEEILGIRKVNKGEVEQSNKVGTP